MANPTGKGGFADNNHNINQAGRPSGAGDMPTSKRAMLSASKTNVAMAIIADSDSVNVIDELDKEIEKCEVMFCELKDEAPQLAINWQRMKKEYQAMRIPLVARRLPAFQLHELLENLTNDEAEKALEKLKKRTNS